MADHGTMQIPADRSKFNLSAGNHRNTMKLQGP